MSSSGEANNNKGSPSQRVTADSDNNDVQDTWETGLRQRRRQRQNSTSSESSQNNVDHQNANENGNRNDRNNTNYRGLNDSAPPGPASGYGSNNNINDSIGVAAGGMCSSGNAGGVSPLTATIPGNTHHFGGGGPYKTPTKESISNDLVAITPSSITTAGDTAASTLVSQTPLRLRRRTRSNSNANNSRGQQQRQPSLRRQYQLLRSQIFLLLGTSTIGLMLFLFYALPLAAFISLALMTTSMGALLPVIRSIIQARYELEMEQPGGLTRYLPDYLRVMLTETSLHDFMTDTTFMMENRYLLLYFMPGLTPEQLMGYIDQLPPRHREALIQPGLGRLMPSVMDNLMRIDNGQQQQQHDHLLLENGDDVSSASGLTVDREHHSDGEAEDDAQVTLLEAVTGLRRTLANAGVALNNGGGNNNNNIDEHQHLVVDMAGANVVQTPLPIEANDDGQVENDANNQNNVQDGDDDDNSSFDFSIDLDVHGLTDLANQQTGGVDSSAHNNNDSGMRNVIVEMPQPLGLNNDSDANQNDYQEEAQQHREYNLEYTILSEAANAAVRNYATQAADIVGDTASDAAVTSSSWFIRVGSWIGLIAGAGGLIATTLANQQGSGRGLSFLSITLGTLTGSTNSPSSSEEGAGGSSNGNGNNTTEIERHNEGSSNGYQSAIHGLFVTSAVSFMGAGVAYLVRNRVRANIATKREETSRGDASNDGQDDK